MCMKARLNGNSAACVRLGGFVLLKLDAQLCPFSPLLQAKMDPHRKRFSLMHFCTEIFIRLAIYIVLNSTRCYLNKRFDRKISTKIVLAFVFADKNVQNACGTYFAEKNGCSDNGVFCVTPY